MNLFKIIKLFKKQFANAMNQSERIAIYLISIISNFIKSFYYL